MTQQFINRNFTVGERDEVSEGEFKRLQHVLNSNAALLHVSLVAFVVELLAFIAWYVWGTKLTMYLTIVPGLVFVGLTVSWWLGVRASVRAVKAIKADIAKRKGVE